MVHKCTVSRSQSYASVMNYHYQSFTQRKLILVMCYLQYSLCVASRCGQWVMDTLDYFIMMYPNSCLHVFLKPV